MPAPIALFVFNRPWHMDQTIRSLQSNELASESELFVFCDGPRSERDLPKVQAVRSYARAISGFKSVYIFENEANKGLAQSVISGVSKVLSSHDSIIVLEDDMLTSRFFLSYMNEGLQLYADDERVISINGYMFPVEGQLPSTFFLKVADCWGWATWKRGWEIFNPHTLELLKQIVFQGKTSEFDFDGSYPYTRQLFNQWMGYSDSWAIRWYASAFLQNKLSLYPKISLVQNIGFDNSGTHTKSWSKDFSNTAIQSEYVTLEKTQVEENADARKLLAQYFLKSRVSTRRKIFETVRQVFWGRNLSRTSKRTGKGGI